MQNNGMELYAFLITVVYFRGILHLIVLGGGVSGSVKMTYKCISKNVNIVEAN